MFFLVVYNVYSPHQTYQKLSLFHSRFTPSIFSSPSISNSIIPIYPNPATSGEGVKINLQGVNKPEILVVVYDMLGRVSYSKVVMNNGSGPLTAIDPHNNLAPGMYIVIGSSKDELFNQKLVIE